ncbi:short-chain dehydrogenase/reductase SDR [Desulfarculus baarsii DSM 2075]|uniref:Short-chain dehydrogenase/reductase SDR n=2 Tax=Desulfarculus baarsii TaxID=453230 RepID=E1QFK5_DESB2|nr:3-hydroxyacyl-CoA dehydrogenase [Desulfarculus baarsii]ADK84341.1 short-chain dehydrogenase/reductase SDR [Desulfarculus baarsii DSM 2075]
MNRFVWGYHMDAKNIVALVTGGASGLGEATARAFVAGGGKAAIFDLDEARGQQIAADLGPAAIFCKVNVVDEASVQAGVAAACAAFGLVNVAVNCAGVGTPAKVLGKGGLMSLDFWNKVIGINLTGTMNVIRYAVEKMAANQPNADGERGVIINTASVAAFEGQVGQAAYSASKGAVVAMTLPLAREFAPIGVRVMTVAPGIFETPMLKGLPANVQEALGKMVPFPSRLGRAEEFAALAAHIVQNSMLNGETIRLDGAIRMQPK